jgi:hypothetical protein
MLAVVTAVEAQVPQTMSYQGVLLDADGTAVPDGSYSLTFHLHDSAVGGATLWTETVSAQVSRGVFNVILGASIPMTMAFDQPYWLGIQVAGGTELSPRTQLTASPYSLRARSVADGTVTGASIASGQVVKSINTLKDDVTLAAGSNVTITPIGNTLTIAAADGDGGDITAVNAGPGLSGGGSSGDVTLSVAVPLSLSGSSGTVIRGEHAGGNFGSLGSSYFGAYGRASGSGRAVFGEHASDNFGEIGTPDYGVYGQNSAGTYGSLGSSVYGADGSHSSGNYGYLGSGTAGASGSHTSGNYGYLGRSGSGVEGHSASGQGVYGESDTGYGISGQSASSSGIYGQNSASLNFGYLGSGEYGVYGENNGTGTYGYVGGGNLAVYGNNPGNHCNGYIGGSCGVGGSMLNGGEGRLGASSSGVIGMFGGTGEGVYGLGGDGPGVMGEQLSSGNYGYLGYYSYGVYGESDDNYGVRGISTNSYGVYATSESSTAVRAIRTGGGDWAGRFSGNVEVTGTLTKGGGAFKIDHPLDPTNKYLCHSFVESPDMMNIYNGNVILDGSGEALVELPAWFEALNKDFRYQLTPIGSPGPNLHIGQRIVANRFKIAGGAPDMEVSWQVTGVRRDPFAEAHRIAVEVDKPGVERGTYLYARECGAPESMGVEHEELQKIEEEMRSNRELHRLGQERHRGEREFILKSR